MVSRRGLHQGVWALVAPGAIAVMFTVVVPRVSVDVDTDELTLSERSDVLPVGKLPLVPSGLCAIPPVRDTHLVIPLLLARRAVLRPPALPFALRVEALPSRAPPVRGRRVSLSLPCTQRRV